MTVPKMFRKNLEEHSQNIMFFDETNQLTYR